MWKADSAYGDCHYHMYISSSLKWEKEKLIPNVATELVVVVDSTSYHKVKVRKSLISN
jgi:hypothetical protein